MDSAKILKGRFAPSPTGRMHLGNVAAALLSWLSIKSKGGRWVLRIEDLDPQRSRLDYARQIEDDLAWLGLEWDEGGVDDSGDGGPYLQSLRSDFYEAVLEKIRQTGLTYPCRCTRADIMATQAPHQSDGRIIYPGTCRPAQFPALSDDPDHRPAATRIFVPDEEIWFSDAIYGSQCINLTRHCGDFVLRRADGAWAYQLAVVADDAAMGITEVVRGSDLLLSAAQQIYLYRILRQPVPLYCHIPLLCNSEGRRLSKRDQTLSMSELRRILPSKAIIGQIAALYGLIDRPQPCTPTDLIPHFNPSCIPNHHQILLPSQP